jgi:hypothetical protein
MLLNRLFSLTACLSLAAAPNIATAQTSLGGTGTADVYEVIPGDTLWDLCSQIFGDPDYWPTLWSINNEEVSNPHYIYPGQRLRFEPGTDVRPPSVLLGDEKVADISFDATFEPLFDFIQGEKDCRLYVPFSSMKVGTPRTLQASSFLARSEVEPLGRLDSAVPNRHGVTLGDVVYLRFRNPDDVNCGDIYSLYHEVKEVRHPEVRTATLGKVYAVTGEVMISDVGDKWVTARIIQAYSEFSRGELLTERIPVTGQVRTRTASQDLDGFVIDKSHDENLLIQRNQVVYIDRGRSDGVESGTTFWVVRRSDGLQTKKRDEDQTLPDQVIGRLVVFSADEHVSTAVLTDQAVDVRIGDRITSRLETDQASR